MTTARGSLFTISIVAASSAGTTTRVQADDALGALAAPTIVPARTLAIALALETSLAVDRAELAPDLWYGVSDRLTLGISHSHRPDGLVGANRGLCVRGCLPADGRYGGVALSAHFPIVTSANDVRVSGIASTDVAALAPAMASLVVGGLAQWHGDRFWAQAGPRLAIGLLGRAAGNRERLTANVTVGAAIVAPLSVEVGVGVRGPASADFFAGADAPLWAQLVLRPRAGFGVGVALGTSDALGDDARRGYAALTFEIRAAT